jgi:hypothetical protein
MRGHALAALMSIGGFAGCIQQGANHASSQQSANELVVWDGDLYADEFSLGFTRGAPPPRRAQHWVHCDSDGCVSTLSVGAYGHAGNGLQFHGEGTGWMGFGFAWSGFDRRQPPLDASRYQGLSFWLRVALHAGSLGSTSVGLHSVDQGKRSGVVSLASVGAEDLADGKWHRIVVPLSALSAKDPNLNLRRLRDFDLGSQGGTRSFDLYLDEIALEERLP